MVKKNIQITVDTVSDFPIVLIVFGSAVFLIAFLGCCGAIVENTCMLFSVSDLLFMVFIRYIEKVFLSVCDHYDGDRFDRSWHWICGLWQKGRIGWNFGRKPK